MNNKALMFFAPCVFLVALFLAGAGTASSQTCTSTGAIRQYLAVCDCGAPPKQTYGCPATGGIKCDPLRDFIKCGTEGQTTCYVPKASNQFCSLAEHRSGITAVPVRGAGSPTSSSDNENQPQSGKLGLSEFPTGLSRPPLTTQGTVCSDNSELRAWLERKLARKAIATVALRSAGGS